MGLGMAMEEMGMGMGVGMWMGMRMGMRMGMGIGMDKMRCELESMEWDANGNGWNEMRMGMDGMRYKWEWMERAGMYFFGTAPSFKCLIRF